MCLYTVGVVQIAIYRARILSGQSSLSLHYAKSFGQSDDSEALSRKHHVVVDTDRSPGLAKSEQAKLQL